MPVFDANSKTLRSVRDPGTDRILTMTNQQTAIIQWLTVLKDAVRQNVGTHEYTYAGIGDFLLTHGTWYATKPLPKHIKRGIPKRCFHNSLGLCRRNGLSYVEGYAVADIGIVFPVHHAWNLDRDGRVIDCTWGKNGLAYFGVVFPLEVADKAVRLEREAVLDNHKDKFRIYREPYGAGKHAPVSA